MKCFNYFLILISDNFPIEIPYLPVVCPSEDQYLSSTMMMNPCSSGKYMYYDNNNNYYYYYY